MFPLLAAISLLFAILIGFAWSQASKPASDVSPVNAISQILFPNSLTGGGDGAAPSATAAAAATPRPVVLFVFAHPDDEAMFFAPTLDALKQLKEQQQEAILIGSSGRKQQQRANVIHNPVIHDLRAAAAALSGDPNTLVEWHFLSVTSGNYDKLGAVREKEMLESGKYFGAKTTVVVEHPKCQDGPNVQWDMEVVAYDIILKHVKSVGATTIFTFDDYGVSGHKNHRDVYKAVQMASARLRREVTGSVMVAPTANSSAPITTRSGSVSAPSSVGGVIPRCYRLRSLPISRKYTSIIGVLLRVGSREEKDRKKQDSGEVVTLVLPPAEGLLSMRGLWKHRSQFVWFRFFYVLFASYSYENTWERFASFEQIRQ